MFWQVLIIFIVIGYLIPGIAYIFDKDWRGYYKRSRRNLLSKHTDEEKRKCKMIIYVVEEIDGEKMVHIETEAFYNDGRGEFSCIDYTWCYVPINDLSNYEDYTCEVQQYQEDYETAEELLSDLGDVLNVKELELDDITEDTPLWLYRTKIDPDLVVDKEKSR